MILHLQGEVMFFLYIMVITQMLAWAYFSYKGGQLNDKQFYIFTFCMLIGQTGASIETFLSQSWATFSVQIFFFLFTAFGGIKRYSITKQKTTQ